MFIFAVIIIVRSMILAVARTVPIILSPPVLIIRIFRVLNITRYLYD